MRGQGPVMKLNGKIFRLDNGKYHIALHCIAWSSLWNSVLHSVLMASNLDGFKRRMA